MANESRGSMYRAQLMAELGQKLEGMTSSGMVGRVIEERTGIHQPYIGKIIRGHCLLSIEKSIDYLESVGVKYKIVKEDDKELAPQAPAKLFAMGSLAEQLKLAVMGRVEALLRRGNTVEDIADRCGLAPWNVERLLDSQQQSSFVELEEVAPMLGLSLSISWRIKE